MKIEIWTDIVCPWCGLGMRYLDQALARFPHRRQVELVHHSFQLMPDYPEGGSEPVAEAISRMHGIPPGELAKINLDLERLGYEAGLIEYHVVDNAVGNTGLAHELLACAADHGVHAAAWHLMFEEYFAKKSPIWTVEDLMPLAAKLGLDLDDTRAALESRRYRRNVVNDHNRAAQLGASGVPFIVMDRRYAISGAQPVEQMLATLQRAWDAGAAAEGGSASAS